MKKYDVIDLLINMGERSLDRQRKASEEYFKDMDNQKKKNDFNVEAAKTEQIMEILSEVKRMED